MPAAVGDIFEIAEMRREMTISPGIAVHDERLQAAFASAVDLIQRSSDRPILDEEVKVRVAPGDEDDPIVLPVHDLLSLTGVTYWEPAGSLRVDPGGVLDITTLGRLDLPDNRRRYPCQFPPEAGWPDILDDSMMIFTCRRGLAEIRPLIKAAIIVYAREMFEGRRSIAQAAVSLKGSITHRDKG